MRYFDEELRIISASIKSMDDDIFEKLLLQSVEALQRGNKIIASGLGKNVPICEKFVGSMISLGLEAYYLNTNSAVHGDLGIVKDGDLVIILTKSGETSESIYLTKLLQERKVTLWLLSFEEISTLATMIDNKLILRLEHESDMWDIMPNNSTTLNLIILQGLAMNIAKKMNITLEQFQKNHPGGHIGDILRT